MASDFVFVSSCDKINFLQSSLAGFIIFWKKDSTAKDNAGIDTAETHAITVKYKYIYINDVMYVCVICYLGKYTVKLKYYAVWFSQIFLHAYVIMLY